MLTKFGPPLFLDHKIKINVGVWNATLWNESHVIEGLVVQHFGISCDEFLEIVEERGGAHELDSIFFLFFGTVFFGAIEKEGGWFEKNEFLEGREGSKCKLNEKK